MRNAPPEAAVERFRHDLIASAGGEPRRLGIAVSGGPDSVALLLLAVAADKQVQAATVDHGLRPESGREAEFVATLCDRLGVAHAILTLPPHRHGNVSDWARRERYAALDRWAMQERIDLVATAHHADDQLETMLMRMNRASGVAGLSGIRARQGRVVRPLLGWRREELAWIVDHCGVETCDDPSNRDHRFDRARMRSALADADWLDPVAAASSAAALSQAETALEWAASAWLEQWAEFRDGVLSLATHDLPDELLRRVVLKCLGAIDPGVRPRGEALIRLIAGLRREKGGTLGEVMCSTSGGRWHFERAPSRREK